MALLSDDVRTSRARQVCDECGGRIEPGDRYRRQVSTYDGFQTYRAHADCFDAVTLYRNMADLYDGDECRVSDFCFEDAGWLWANFPRVAERIRMPPMSWAFKYVNGYGI